tara:strand:+ start:508 stop:1701 length:1194 start_codon:yes stop_codon:yes gene_type:complete
MRSSSSLQLRSKARIRLALATLIISAASVLISSAAYGQQPQDPENPGFVEVIEVSGLLDDVLAEALENSIVDAQKKGANGLVLQVNSREAIIPDQKLIDLARLIRSSQIPIEVWVGPSGSTAQGKIAQLILVADSLGVSIGSSIGKTGSQVLSQEEFGQIWATKTELLKENKLQWDEAIEEGLVACERVLIDEIGNSLTDKEQLARCANPTLGDFLVKRESFISEIVETEGGPRLSPLTITKINRLNLIDQLMHTVASPPVAYLLLISGLVLLLFEFFSIGVGIAGAIGAIAFALSSYGLTALPFRTWALVLIIFSMFAFAVDIQTVIPRLWTVIGLASFSAGTIFLYPEQNIQMSWIPMLVGITGMLILMVRGMPIMVRGRFATTQITRVEDSLES